MQVWRRVAKGGWGRSGSSNLRCWALNPAHEDVEQGGVVAVLPQERHAALKPPPPARDGQPGQRPVTRPVQVGTEWLCRRPAPHGRRVPTRPRGVCVALQASPSAQLGVPHREGRVSSFQRAPLHRGQGWRPRATDHRQPGQRPVLVEPVAKFVDAYTNRKVAPVRGWRGEDGRTDHSEDGQQPAHGAAARRVRGDCLTRRQRLGEESGLSRNVYQKHPMPNYDERAYAGGRLALTVGSVVPEPWHQISLVDARVGKWREPLCCKAFKAARPGDLFPACLTRNGPCAALCLLHFLAGCAFRRTLHTRDADAAPTGRRWHRVTACKFRGGRVLPGARIPFIPISSTNILLPSTIMKVLLCCCRRRRSHPCRSPRHRYPPSRPPRHPCCRHRRRRGHAALDAAPRSHGPACSPTLFAPAAPRFVSCMSPRSPICIHVCTARPAGQIGCN